MKKDESTRKPIQISNSNGQSNKTGYPLYPDNEDIYKRSKEEDLDPEDLLSEKSTGDLDSDLDEVEELDGNIMGSDLDIPGAELDDENEDSGNEDEENNYYSIGGDRHNDLDEEE